MTKVISFSLWGNNPNYNIGAIKNAELAKEYYPDFKCWFYIHKDSVPQSTVDALQTMSNSRIIFKEGDLNTCKPMSWRFESIDNDEVEVMMARDTDTRILYREVLAVREWLNSDKIFHIMRDHPHHDHTILGGMFGTKKISEIKSWSSIINEHAQTGQKMYDMIFLNNFIYPLIKDNVMVHASFYKWENGSKNFPIPFDNQYKFVGEYVYADESRSQSHIDALIFDLQKVKQ